MVGEGKSDLEKLGYNVYRYTVYTVYIQYTQNTVEFSLTEDIILIWSIFNCQRFVKAKAGLKPRATIFARPTFTAFGEHVFLFYLFVKYLL